MDAATSMLHHLVRFQPHSRHADADTRHGARVVDVQSLGLGLGEFCL
jgi:hypothetical protein